MTHTWASIPLLPLRCILDHLSTEDALAAMSTCRHWRLAVGHYEGQKETLKLKVKHLEKNLYLTRMFKRYTRKLHIYLECSELELDQFLNYVLPQFCDTVKLEELIFIGPSYIMINHLVPFVKLKRVVTESLVFKHIKCIKKIAFMGCGMGSLLLEDHPYAHPHVEFYSRQLKFSSVHTPADSILSNANRRLMLNSTLTQIQADYDQIITPSLETLANLTNFRHLVLNITSMIPSLVPVNWESVNHTFKHRLQVTINIIAVSYRNFNNIMDNVLLDGLNLVSLKVLFCESLYTPLLSHVSRLYKSSLQEVVWADSPCESSDPYYRIVRPMRHAQPSTYAHVNPFVLLCWQCTHLRRLAIHGYWVWQYDLLGFVRLRKTISQLEISAVYNKEDKFNGPLKLSEEGAVRVLYYDSPAPIDPEFINEVNEFTECKWKPTPWTTLHPALRGVCTPHQRADYIVKETTMPLGATTH